MNEDKEGEKDLEALVEEQAEQEGTEDAEATADAQVDRRKSKSVRVGLVISS